MVKLSTRRPVGARRRPAPVEVNHDQPKPKAAPKRNAILITKPAARLSGGPRDGWVYFIEDLERIEAADAYFGRVFPYAPNGGRTMMPDAEDEHGNPVYGAIWSYRA